MRPLSKSKLLAFRQCPKRLWLEVHRPELKEDSAATEASYRVGHTVGDIARRLYDPANEGVFVDRDSLGLTEALRHSAALLGESKPVFEAGFSAGGAMAFADVMLPTLGTAGPAWRLVEVKASTGVRPYQEDDVAVQAYIARRANIALSSAAVAHVDNTWVYPGDEDYQGLLVEVDVTAQAVARDTEVAGWIAQAHQIVCAGQAPAISTGSQCGHPYACGFHAYCHGQEPQAEFPVSWLPRIQSSALKAAVDGQMGMDMRAVPDELLNETQLRVKRHTVSGQVYFDRAGAAAELAGHGPPAWFLDFETIQFAIPIWKGTRPYQQIPFQFSLHALGQTGELSHTMHLDLSGDDPSRRLAEALVAACGESGPIFAYHAGFERSCVNALAERIGPLSEPLRAIEARIVDLLPTARKHYYHPDQQGSWSLKSVFPTLGEPGYEQLDGVKDGGAAMEAYLEAIAPQTSRARKDELDRQLREYCELDTLALVRLFRFFTGRS